MTDHLPECIYAPEQFDTEQNIVWGWKPCICDALRACEQRVAAMRKDSGELWLDGYGTGFQDGHSYALDAAREAVNSMVIETAGNSAATVNQALVAIDALREKP